MVNSTLRKTLSLLLFISIGVIIQHASFYTLLRSTVNPFEKSIEEVERKDFLFLLISTTLFIILVISVRLLSKNGLKYSATGLTISASISFCLMLTNGIAVVKNHNYHEQFDAALWTQPELRSINMGKTMLYDHSLHNLSREEVISKLGNPDDAEFNEYNNYLNYYINPKWFFRIYFRNGRSYECRIFDPGFTI